MCLGTAIPVQNFEDFPRFSDVRQRSRGPNATPTSAVGANIPD